MSKFVVPISMGELLDKYSILLVKLEKITDKKKLVNINKELDALFNVIYESDLKATGYTNLLLGINKQLWDVEEAIREKERSKDFGADFVFLARSVYRLNDLRFKVKNLINEVFNSEIREEKSH